MGITRVVFGKFLPKLGRNLETNPANISKIFENVFAKERSLQKAEFGEIFEHFGEIPKIRFNAQEISDMHEYKRNIILNIPSSSLRETSTELVKSASDAAKKGWDYSKEIHAILEDISLLDIQKDKRVISELNKILKSFTEKFDRLNHGRFIDLPAFENELAQASDLASIPARARGEVMNIRGRVREALKLNPKLKDASRAKDLEESMKQESLVTFLGDERVKNGLYKRLEHTKEFNDYLYNEYYIKRHSFGLGADEPLRAINKYYRTKVFVPYKASEEVADDVLREFHAWNKAGGENVKWEKTLTFDDYDSAFFDPHMNTCGATGYASPKNFIRIKSHGLKALERAPYIRHEKLHIQDSLPVFGKFGKNGKYDFTEGSKILTEKKWYRDEFKNAGIPDMYIEYAYTNRAEFIAVAAQGNPKAYSEEFKQVLIDLGMPEWFFNIRKFKSYNC